MTAPQKSTYSSRFSACGLCVAVLAEWLFSAGCDLRFSSLDDDRADRPHVTPNSVVAVPFFIVREDGDILNLLGVGPAGPSSTTSEQFPSSSSKARKAEGTLVYPLTVHRGSALQEAASLIHEARRMNAQ